MQELKIASGIKEGKNIDSIFVSLFLYGAVDDFMEQAEEHGLKLHKMVGEEKYEEAYKFLEKHYEIEELDGQLLQAEYEDMYLRLTGEIEPIDMEFRPGTEIELTGEIKEAVAELGQVYQRAHKLGYFYTRMRDVINNLINVIVIRRYPFFNESNYDFTLEVNEQSIKVGDNPEDVLTLMKGMQRGGKRGEA